MTCYAMESEYESGVRFIPVRRTQGAVWLHTLHVGQRAAETLAAAQLSDARELGPEWAAENELIGVAEVDLRIVALHPVAELAPAGVA